MIALETEDKHDRKWQISQGKYRERMVKSFIESKSAELGLAHCLV